MDAVPAVLGTPSHPCPSESFLPGVVEVKIERAMDLDEALQDAVTLVLKVAMEHQTGIMVTRMDVGRYIVQTHPEVPVGLIRERHVGIPGCKPGLDASSTSEA